MSYLNISNVDVVFPIPNGAYIALREVHLEIEQGEFIAHQAPLPFAEQSGKGRFARARRTDHDDAAPIALDRTGVEQ